MNPFVAPEGIDPLVFKALLWKRYFDTGYGLTNYVKYLIALFGISSLQVGATIGLAFFYALLCVVVGRLWHTRGIINVEVEIANRFNDFVTEMRELAKNSKNVL